MATKKGNQESKKTRTQDTHLKKDIQESKNVRNAKTPGQLLSEVTHRKPNVVI
jgi:hypothetical protein